MIRATLVRRAALALATFTLACGDSTGPNANLSETQVYEMLEVMSMVASPSEIPGAGTGGFPALRAGPTTTANATVSVSETVDCPNGGTASVSGFSTDNPDAGTLSAEVTHDFDGCAATSEEGRVWTFNGNPNIVTTLNATFNDETGEFSMTTTQVGGISFTSDVASGGCQINLTFTLTRTETSLSGSLSGSACGRNIQRVISVES